MISAKYEKLFGEVAKSFASMSYCERGKVGAIAVKNNRIIGSAYNGTPSGMPNVCEVDGVTSPITIHAEMNLLIQMAKSTESIEGADIVCTMTPCVNCAKHIIQAGVKNFFYVEKYRDDEGWLLLQQNGINVWKIGD